MPTRCGCTAVLGLWLAACGSDEAAPKEAVVGDLAAREALAQDGPSEARPCPPGRRIEATAAGAG